MGFSPGLCKVSTDLDQLLHVIVGFGYWFYSVVEVIELFLSAIYIF